MKYWSLCSWKANCLQTCADAHMAARLHVVCAGDARVLNVVSGRGAQGAGMRLRVRM